MTTQTYAKWLWIERFALVENCQPMYTFASAQLARMERMYGDIFADVRTQVCRKFIHTSNGWAVKFNA